MKNLLIILSLLIFISCSSDKLYKIEFDYTQKDEKTGNSSHTFEAEVNAENDSLAFYHGAAQYHAHRQASESAVKGLEHIKITYEYNGFDVFDENGYNVANNLNDSTKSYLEDLAKSKFK